MTIHHWVEKPDLKIQTWKTRPGNPELEIPAET
jgi:hypothetical protein